MRTESDLSGQHKAKQMLHKKVLDAVQIELEHILILCGKKTAIYGFQFVVEYERELLARLIARFFFGA